MIKTQNIFKSYNNGRTSVLKDISLEVDDGKFAVILGASGSGKTTLMSVLSGLESVDSGTVLCNGSFLNEMNDKQLTEFRRNEVGFVFQQYYLLSHLSVLANVKLGANLTKNESFEEIIANVGLSEKMKCKPAELSGGEQQRVCIARALAKKPKILFADEPTGALDEETGRDILNYLLKLQSEQKFTFIMVTHNQNIAETADSVIVMNSGKITKSFENKEKKSAYEIGW